MTSLTVMHTHLVAIGGGEVGREETDRIDRHILDLTGAPKPVMVFIPAASGDDEEYIARFTRTYEQELGTKVVVLTIPDLYDRNKTHDTMMGANGLFYGGGSSGKLFQELFDSKADKDVTEWVRIGGKVLSGVSAGANILYEKASSLADPKGTANDVQLLDGMGIIKGHIVSPHFAAEEHARLPALLSQLQILPGFTGIGVDDFAAYVTRLDGAGVPEEEYAIRTMQRSRVRQYVRDAAGNIAVHTI